MQIDKTIGTWDYPNATKLEDCIYQYFINIQKNRSGHPILSSDIVPQMRIILLSPMRNEWKEKTIEFLRKERIEYRLKSYEIKRTLRKLESKKRYTIR